MIPCDAAPGGADVHGAAYEQLREEVLAGAAPGSQGRSLGLVLVLRAGIAAWMTQRAASPAAPAPQQHRPAIAPLPPGELHANVVRVLASIALAHREGWSR